MNRHLIQKQVVELTIDEIADFHPLANAFNDMIKHELLPKLSAHFDQLADEETVITSNRLEIDLGVIDWNNQQETLSDRLAELIIKKITSLVSEKQEDMILFEVTPVAPVTVRRWLAWQQYLETGLMPWFAETPLNQQEWEAMLLETPVSMYHPAVTDIINKVINNEEARKRLILVFSLSFIESVAKATGRINAACSSIPELSRRLEKEMNVLPGTFQKISRDIFLIAANHSDPRIPVIDFLDRAIRMYPYPDWVPVLAGLHRLPDIHTIFPSEATLEEILQFTSVLLAHKQETAFRHALQKIPGAQALQTHFSSAAFAIIREQNNIDQYSTDVKANERLPGSNETFIPVSSGNDLPLIYKKKEERTNEPHYVPYAGLVLAAPFLPVLFEATGLLKEGVFRNTEAQIKAVRLAGFLASGQPDTPDWELAVAKTVCGLMPADTLTTGELPDERSLQEATGLLKAMISHWKALGRSSPDGLRQGFLERRGKLSMQQNDWLLQVESRAIDILLDRLPWGFGIIRLPWMTGILKTEWQGYV